MNFAEQRNWDARRRLVMAFVSLLLLLLISVVCPAQTVTATPTSIDPAKPKPVTLTIKKADGSVDTALTGQVDSVKVGEQPPEKPQPPDVQGNITFTPPAKLSGAQQVQLLGKDGKPLLDSANKPLGIQLTYSSGGGADGNSNQTNDLARMQAERAEDRRDKLVFESNWYYVLITGMFAVLLIPFGWTIVRVIRFSRSSFNSPLGLPVGSFRAILAYTLVTFLGFYILTSVLSVSYFSPPEFLLGIVATVVGFYFGSRSGEEAGGGAQIGTVQGTVTKADGTPAVGAGVELSQTSGKKITQTADAQGKYEFDSVPVGDYNIQASLTGSMPSDPAKVKVTAGATQTINLKLK
jgi:hypothetical protein